MHFGRLFLVFHIKIDFNMVDEFGNNFLSLQLMLLCSCCCICLNCVQQHKKKKIKLNGERKRKLSNNQFSIEMHNRLLVCLNGHFNFSMHMHL